MYMLLSSETAERSKLNPSELLVNVEGRKKDKNKGRKIARRNRVKQVMLEQKLACLKAYGICD
jgi:hypothetical protein